MTKILAIGDFHGKLPVKLKNIVKKEKIDFILCTGDFGGSKELLQIIFKYFTKNWFEVVGLKKAKELIMRDYQSGKKVIRELNKLGKPVYTVHGNWDFEQAKHKRRAAGLRIKKYSELMKKLRHMHFLNKQMRTVHGVRILGFGGMVTPFVYCTKEGPFDKAERGKYRKIHEKEKKQLLRKARKDIDIFLSHYPPYGVFDIVKYKGENPMKGKHVGFKGYTDFIKKHKPRLFICGHMHEYQGRRRIGDTLVVSTGPAFSGKGAVIEVGGRKKIKVKFVR
jgi:Icc-related predicted phosphoesterase